MAKATDDPTSLKRLGGGRWQTRDDRFTIEPQSGTWVVVDAEQTDDLGLPLVRGPFGSLRDAKAAIEHAREAEPASSPLSARVEEHRKHPPTKATTKGTGSPPASERTTKGATSPEAPAEPRWLTELDADARRRARRLIDRLAAAGAKDAEAMARRDLLGNVPVVAGYAVGRAVRGLGSDATPATVAGLLAAGHDDALDVEWRLVDGAGRPIAIDLDAD